MNIHQKHQEENNRKSDTRSKTLRIRGNNLKMSFQVLNTIGCRAQNIVIRNTCPSLVYEKLSKLRINTNSVRAPASPAISMYNGKRSAKASDPLKTCARMR
mmetsp:Transcript_24710/g.32258  ORF Transcript_24710/g.32258 Transcript_24710/m.32258 type:complete len:101 (+) Transcript_24710:1910-2212(+)